MVKLIATMFHVRHSTKGASLLLRRMGWTPQMPSQLATERNEATIVGG
jgi:transposase